MAIWLSLAPGMIPQGFVSGKKTSPSKRTGRALHPTAYFLRGSRELKPRKEIELV
jgi:hypothetical protein